MAMRRGYEAKVDINGQPYRVKSWSWDDNAPSLDVTNTEGAPGNAALNVDASGFQSKLGSARGGRVRLTNPTFDDDDNPFAAPIALQGDAYYEIRIWQAGRGSVSVYFPSALCTRVGQTGEATALQPIEAEFESDAGYDLPGT